MIFTTFGETTYNGVSIANIFHSLQFYYDIIKNNFTLRKYEIPNDHRPERVAYELYGDPSMYWVLFLINEITDPYHDWIKSTSATQETAEYQYTYAGGTEQVDHYVDEQDRQWFNVIESPDGSKNWYSKNHDGGADRFLYRGTMVPISATEHEQNLNESKRVIQVIAPGEISTFVNQLLETIGNLNANS